MSLVILSFYFLFLGRIILLLFLRLSTERTKTSFSESSAVISAFFECLRFIMQQNLGEEEMEQMLVNEQVRVQITRAQAHCVLLTLLVVNLHARISLS